MKTHRVSSLVISAALVLLSGLAVSADVHAQRARGGGAHATAGAGHSGARASAHTSVNRPAGDHAVNRNQASTSSRNVNRNVNREQNVNVNRNVNVDVDYHDHDHWNDWDDHPFATAAAVTAGVAVTSAVIGSIVNSVPPSCVTTVVNGIAYQQCGNTWYQPQYAGTTVQYVVVNAP
ncbi:MAG TPA: hypothetical protein VM469_04230 [Pseudoxanthomonas sp.]|jgi:long-subunit fatty acid transport protein|nr:hypothetical protein [Pseudoxanthomonas sp.]